MNSADMVILKEKLREFRTIFPETSKIFNTLALGNYINKNSSKTEERRYYKILIDNSSIFKEYFSLIGFALIIEDGYCYFTDKSTFDSDEKINGETNSQIDKYLEYVYIYTFLKAIHNYLDANVGYEFTISGIEDAVNNNSELKSQMPVFNKNDTNRKAIETILSRFVAGGFIEEINKKDGRYRTLDCLQRLVLLIKNTDLIEEE